MTEDLKKLESLDYKPKIKTVKEMAEDFCNHPDSKPVKPSPATLGFNSHVIKPEMRVNKREDAGQPFEQSKCKECKYETIDDKPCEWTKIDKKGCSAFTHKPDQPNKNLMIIEEIEGLISQVNDKLCELEPVEDTKNFNDVARKKWTLKSQALEEIDLFQKTTLFELRKVFE